MWTLDKFVNPGHAAQVFAGFYGIANAQSVMLAVGLAELALVVAFVIGLFKRWTYGLVLLLHGISTFASFGKYLQPWDSLLFSPPGRCWQPASHCTCCAIRIRC